MAEILKWPEKKRITQEELSKLAHISRSSLANYESGLREPKGAILVNIALALDTTTDYLLGHTDIYASLKKNNGFAISDHPELLGMWSDIKSREELQLLLREVQPMTSENIKKIIKIIKVLGEGEKG